MESSIHILIFLLLKNLITKFFDFFSEKYSQKTCWRVILFFVYRKKNYEVWIFAKMLDKISLFSKCYHNFHEEALEKIKFHIIYELQNM